MYADLTCVLVQYACIAVRTQCIDLGITYPQVHIIQIHSLVIFAKSVLVKSYAKIQSCYFSDYFIWQVYLTLRSVVVAKCQMFPIPVQCTT